jgi:hypothetical protein
MTRVEQITNAAGLYGAGIIGSAELWNKVGAASADNRPRDFLDDCLL